MNKRTNNTQISQSALKEAYKVVIIDLTEALVKMKADQSVRLNGIGTFTKKKRKINSALDGKTYQYYQITFKTSQTLKRALDK